MTPVTLPALRTKRLASIAVCLSLGLPISANAQDAPLRQLAPVVVYSTALPLTEATINQHVSVFTRAEIEREAPASLSDFLVRRAGLTIDHRARSGAFGSLYLRGADPSHVVVLIDGIRQNDPLSSRGSAVDLNTLTLDDVERIEVVRGSSTVEHSEALAGVVQIFTRAPGNMPAARFSADAGGKGLAAVAASFTHGPWHASIMQREDGDRDTIGFSRARAANLGFLDRWGATRLRAQVRLADSVNDAFPDDSGGPRFSVNRALERRRSDSQQYAIAADRQLSSASALELRVAHFRRDSGQDTPRVFPGSRDPAGLPAVDTDARYRRSEGQLNWRWHGDSGWDVVLGAGTQRESGRLDSTISFGPLRLPADFDIDRRTDNILGEARKSFGPWSVQLGLRYERTPGEENMRHPAAGVQYQASPGSGRFGAAISSAKKLPSFYALGHPLVGNPALRPEKSEQAEVYYATPDAAPWKGRITLFQAHYRDLIDIDSGPPPRLVNRSSIRGTGLELNLRRQWNNGLLLFAQGTLINLRPPEGAPPLRLRPRRQGSAGIEFPLAPRWRLQTSVNHIGPRFDSSIPTGDADLGGYSEVNLALTWRGTRWQSFAAIDNLLNHKGEETIGTPIIGPRFHVGIRWSM